jgi:hypothetical protein
MVMDKRNSPACFLFDLFKDLDYFFLFSADSEIFTGYCKASDGCRSDAPGKRVREKPVIEELKKKRERRGEGGGVRVFFFRLPIFDVSHDPTYLPRMC